MKRTFAIILLIPALLFGTVLTLNRITQSNAQKQHLWLMETLLPGGQDFVRLSDTGEDEIIRSVHRSDAGYVIETVTRGYADDIVMYIGVNNVGKVTGLVTHEAHETPGLGSGILNNHVFLSQFLNKSGTFTVGTPGPDAFSGATESAASAGEDIHVDAISGATVSSKAVARSVSAAVAYVTGVDISSSATEWGG